MAKFLRDKKISNITMDENNLVELFTLLEKRVDALQVLPHDENEEFYVYAVIRFDSKGYRVHSTKELLHYFRSSQSIERIILFLQDTRAVNTNNVVGSYIELRLDGTDPNSCILQVSSDYSEWMDSSFSTLEEALNKAKNRHGWSRSQWFGLLVQLSGVFAGFVISIWAAVVITPSIPVENAFVIVFLFVLLLFSNTWDYLKILISNTIDNCFPNIEFIRPEKEKYRWLIQTVVGGIVVAIILYILSSIFRFVGDELSKFFMVGG